MIFCQIPEERRNLQWPDRGSCVEGDQEDDPEELRCQSQVKDKRDRSRVWQDYYETTEQAEFVETLRPMKYLTKRQFLAHYTQTEMMTKAEAEKMWDTAAANPDVPSRKNNLGEITYAVALLEVVNVGKRVLKKRGHKMVEQPGASSDEDDFENRSKRKVRATTIQKPEDSLEALGEEPTVMENLVAAPSWSEVARKRWKSLGSGSLSSEHAGGLDDVVSHSSGPTAFGTPTVATATAEDGSSLSLVKARQMVKSKAKKLTNDLWNKKSSSAMLLKAMVLKLGDDHLEVSSLSAGTLIETLDQHLVRLRAAAAQSDHWGADTYMHNFKEAMVCVGHVTEAGEAVKHALVSLKNVRLAEVRENAGDRRRLGLKIRRFFSSRPLPPQGFPSTLVSWLGQQVFKLSLDSDAMKVETSEGLIVADGSPAGADLKIPALWPNDAKAAFPSTVKKIMSDCSAGDMRSNVEALKNHLQSAEAVNANMARVGFKKDAKPTDVAPWIPQLLHSGGTSTEMSLGVGSPWLFGSKKFGFRGTANVYPFMGVGSILYCIEGEVLVILTPAQKVLDSGSSIGEYSSMITNLAPGDACRWMNENSKIMLLTAGAVAWIPYGYLPWHICCSDNPGFVIYQPVFSSTLLEQVPKELSAQLVKWMDLNIQNAGEERPWRDIGAQARRWLARFE